MWLMSSANFWAGLALTSAAEAGALRAISDEPAGAASNPTIRVETKVLRSITFLLQ
jgi:hypothetical protein